MLQNGIRADSRGFTGTYGRKCGGMSKGAWGADATGMCTGAWRVSSRASGMRRWHWTHGRGTGPLALDARMWHMGCWHWTYGMWPREDISGLTDEDVGLLRG